MIKSIFLIPIILSTLFIIQAPKILANNWVSPTGHSDPDNDWSAETNAYDDNTATYATGGLIWQTGWTKYLYLTIDSISCNKIRFMVYYYVDVTWEIDVFKDETWINVYSGVPSAEIWVEVAFDSGTVSQMRFRYYKNYMIQPRSLKEADFYEVEAEEYEFSVGSIPFIGVNFTFDGIGYQTNFSDVFEEGSYNVVFPSEWSFGDVLYKFKNWSDGETSTSRIIVLNQNISLWVLYEEIPKTDERQIIAFIIIIISLSSLVLIISSKHKRRKK